MSKFPKVSHPRLYIAYLIIVFVCGWIGLHDDGYIQILIKSISNVIPSISSLAAIAPNQTKAAFDLALAWCFGAMIPFFSFKNLDWDFIENRHNKFGGTIVASLVLIICGLLTLLMLAVPMTPSATRRGMLISMWFRLDIAYIWGCAIILVTGFAWSFIAMSIIILYRKFSKESLSK